MADLSGARLLIVEDEALIVEELRDRLSRLGATVVGSAASGLAALGLADSTAPDLILLDIRLKGVMDGIEVAEKLGPGAAVVFLTAHADEATIARAKRVNPSGYLLKPFDDAVLRVVLELALYRHFVGRELNAREETIRAAQQRLIEAENLETVRRIAGGMAHDLNNVMTVVTGFSELLLTRTEDWENRRMIEKVRRAGERSAHLTRQLLGFSRRLMLAPAQVDLVDYISSLEPNIQAALSPSVHLGLAFDGRGCSAYVDPTKLREIVLSLVDNANRAMPDGGRLILELSTVEQPSCGPSSEFDALPPGRYARLAVIDAGVGMDAETRARLFEPFAKPKPFDRSTGLSLAAANGIIRQSGGCVRVESAPGAGTAVEIYLPSSAAEQAA